MHWYQMLEEEKKEDIFDLSKIFIISIKKAWSTTHIFNIKYTTPMAMVITKWTAQISNRVLKWPKYCVAIFSFIRPLETSW